MKITWKYPSLKTTIEQTNRLAIAEGLWLNPKVQEAKEKAFYKAELDYQRMQANAYLATQQAQFQMQMQQLQQEYRFAQLGQLQSFSQNLFYDPLQFLNWPKK